MIQKLLSRPNREKSGDRYRRRRDANQREKNAADKVARRQTITGWYSLAQKFGPPELT